MHGIIWSLTTITTIIPLLTNTYGPAGGWCWFKDDTTISTIERYVLFYGLVWLSIVYMIYIYIKTWIKIRKMNKDTAAKNVNGTSCSRTDTGTDLELESIRSPSSAGGLSVGSEETRNNIGVPSIRRCVVYNLL